MGNALRLSIPQAADSVTHNLSEACVNGLRIGRQSSPTRRGKADRRARARGSDRRFCCRCRQHLAPPAGAICPVRALVPRACQAVTKLGDKARRGCEDACMRYIQGEARGQQTLFPMALEDLIPADHLCRVIDAFVGRLGMGELGFERAEAAETGRPG